MSTVGVRHPFGMEAAGGGASVFWPISPPRLRLVLGQVLERIAARLDEYGDGEERRVALLALPEILSAAAYLVELSFLAHSHRPYQEEPAEVSFLRGDGPALAARAAPPRQRVQRKPLMALRRIRCLRRWTPWHRLPQAVLAPRATVVSHGTFLDAELRVRSEAATCYESEQLLLASIAHAAEPRIDFESLAQELAATIAGSPAVPPESASALAALVQRVAAPALGTAAHHIASLTRHRTLPRRLLSGTGGTYAARALGIEVLRRGGEVERFDHGGPYGFVALSDYLQLVELAVASRFVAMTEQKATYIRAQLPTVAPTWTTRTVDGGHGDPSFRRSYRPSRNRRRRVVYATTLFRGPRQYLRPLLSDVVYLDWQRRLLTALAAANVDVVLKPHPGGNLEGKRHPLADSVEIDPRPFEDTVDGADLFVFDYMQTTAFWSAACSDRPIVFVDLGISEVHPLAGPLLGARCRTITARYDEANRPWIDERELRDAVAGDGPPADVHSIRRMLAGDDARAPVARN